MTDTPEQRKQKAKDAGYTNPFCAACANLSSPSSKTCRQCIAATPNFTKAARQFLEGWKGTMQ